MLERFRPHENERGLTFGLTWSAVGCALALVGLTSCGYLVPDDSRPPRYNSVVGERRTPVLNNAVGVNTPPPQDEDAYPAMTGGAPMRPAGNPNHASAPAPMPTASVNTPGGTMPSVAGGPPKRSFWDKTRGWVFGEDAEIGGSPVPLGAPLPPGAMKDLPEEEAETVALAMGSSSEYPKLQDVQDIPPASVEARDRLLQAQEALRIDKERAAYERDAIAREAVSEPTLLEQYKQGKLPPAPTPQPMANGDDVSVNLPSTAAPAPVQAQAPLPQQLPEPDMVIDLSRPSDAELQEMAETPPPPPAPTVNVVRGIQSEVVEIREPATDASAAGYLPASRYEMRAATTN